MSMNAEPQGSPAPNERPTLPDTVLVRSSAVAAPKKAEAFEVFRDELMQRDEELASLLPSTVTLDAFRNVAIIAVKKNPDLLKCDRRSLHNAVTAAAIDGLIPDGKEGVIIPQKEDGTLAARWAPMAHGIRKRARELDGIIIDAKVVCKNDSFEWEEGDNSFIRHIPAPLDQDPGQMIGVYAIFRKGDSVLHHEVLRQADVMAVKSISRQPGGLMWKTFEGEAWRKSAIRRGIKTVPCSDNLRTIVERFDDMHDVGAAPRAIEAEPARIAIPPPSPPPGRKAAPIAVGGKSKLGEAQEMLAEAVEKSKTD